MQIFSSGIKKYMRIVICCICSAFLCFFSACYTLYEQNQKGIKISIVDSVFFTASQSSATVQNGEDFTVTLDMSLGYIPISCDYYDYDLVNLTGRKYRLTLKNIRRPLRVNVISQKEKVPLNANPEKNCSIVYYYNDGTGMSCTVDYKLSYHIRPNTLIGEGIWRDGYTLTGWNTAADGSGEHIGLGSRVTVPDGAILSLYGEWSEWLPQEDFSYVLQQDGTAVLVSYGGKGDARNFVVPGKIDNYIVSGISSSFTSDMPCGNLSSEVLVLPASIITIHSGAFVNAAFREICFCDSLEVVEPMAFSNNIETYRVNSVMAPRLQKGNYNVRFADNLDIVISNADKKKLILFSGCSLSYGLNSVAVSDAFKEYIVVNAGLNGEFDALFQLECMLPYISEGDVLVHAPEQKNSYQFFLDNSLDGRVFAMAEGNYDLLANVDFSYSDKVFAAWGMYVNLRKNAEECSYQDHTGMFNNYGDIAFDRPYDESNEAARDVSYTQNWGFDLTLLTEKNIAVLTGVYDMFVERGADVYFSWAPINEQADGNYDIYAVAKEFEQRLENLLLPCGYRIISEATDYIFKGRYFYDSDYHLNDVGVMLRTKQLILDMKTAGI